MYKKIVTFLFLVLLSSGCLADAFSQETYTDPDNDTNMLILFGDGTYRWHQTNYDKSGEWYEEDGVIYLDVDSFLGDMRLERREGSVFWSNGAEWVKD